MMKEQPPIHNEERYTREALERERRKFEAAQKRKAEK